MRLRLGPSVADRRLLPEGRLAGPMPWVIAIMMFLTVLAAGAGLGLRSAATGLTGGLADRITVQIVEADPVARERQAARAMAELSRLSGIADHRRVAMRDVEALVAPWLGGSGIDADVPLPALIDVDLAPGARNRIDVIRDAMRRVAPSASIDDHARWLAPLAGLMRSLEWLALALVLMMSAATAFTVVLAARAALDTHRSTIDVMHLLGATDVQIARLFQRRIALDALFGGFIGLAGGAIVILLVGAQIRDVGSELMTAVQLSAGAWILIAMLPLIGAALATVAARLTILSALGRIL